MRVLLITSLSPAFDSYSYYHDWMAAFQTYPDMQADILDVQDKRFLKDALTLRPRYDLIVFLHSAFAALDSSTRLTWVKRLLTGRRGERVFFLSNEFRNLSRMTDMARYLGAGAVVSQLHPEDAAMLYKPLWEKSLLCLSYGFDPATFRPTTPLSERLIHVGFRGDYYPAYVGHDDRDLLLDQFKREVAEHPRLKTDIEVGQRYERLEWAAFLNQCRALLGHEAGATRIDSDENIRHFLNAQEKRLTPENFRKVVLTLRETGVFDPPPSGRIAAPRNFEAMGTKTVQILLPGRYNDLLRPGENYLELQRDFSNLDSVIETLFDEAAASALAERAYQDGLAHHTYHARVRELIQQVLG